MSSDEDVQSIVEAYPGFIEIHVQTEEKEPADNEIPFEKKFEAMKIEKEAEEEFSPEVIQSAKIDQENPFNLNSNSQSNLVVHKGISCVGIGIMPIFRVRY